MGVSAALFSGVSGLNANGNAMSVIGNNIANSNTIGFKSSRTVFGDLLSSQVSGSGGTSQVGRGVGLSVVDNIFSQGTFENTELNTDLAVEGPGFFIVSDPSTGNVTNNYTRAGSFRFNGEGFLVNPEGYNLMGYNLDANGNTFGDLTPIKANTQSFTAAGPTGNVTFNTNFDSDSQALALPNVANASAMNVLFPNAAYTDLMANPEDSVIQTAATTQAAADLLTANATLTTANTTLATANTTLTTADAALVTANAAVPQVPADILAAQAAVDAAQAAVTAAQTAATVAQAAVTTGNQLVNQILAGPFDPANPGSTSNSATSIRLFDSLGSTHLMSTYFTKTDNNEWTWNSVVDGGDLVGGTPGELAVVGSGTLDFNDAGQLIAIDGRPLYDAAGDPIIPAPTAQTNPGALPWSNGAGQDQLVTFDMQTTQFASPSTVASGEQDGYGTGTLVKLKVDDDGNVVGNFSNGQPRQLMRLALSKFTNPGAMDKIGSNMWAVSGNSGPPVIGTVGSGVGNIFTNALEQSNVDLAQEFVKMITTQRGFSANSKTITTTDEMLAEVINLKR